jgi:hypothetical protein
MSCSQTKDVMRSTALAVVAAIGLSIVSVTAAVAAPEDEIARLDRVRANLCEELIKTRADAASARAELEAALKARDAAEAELARLKQEAVSAKPAVSSLSAAPKAEPQQSTTTAASPATRRQSTRRTAPRTTGSVQRTVTASTPHRVVRPSVGPRAFTRQTNQGPRQSAAPVARAQELPSVLRLQDPQ